VNGNCNMIYFGEKHLHILGVFAEFAQFFKR
jgi:hypothetical protein